MREKFEYNINHEEEKSSEEEKIEKEKKNETLSINNENEGGEIKWKAEAKDEDSDGEKNEKGEKRNYKEVEISSLKPSDKFFIKDENGNLIKSWGVTKIDKGRDVNFFTEGGIKQRLHWGDKVWVPILPKQEKLRIVALGELNPGDKFKTEDGREGTVIIKYEPGRVGGKDISVRFRGEDAVSWLHWNEKVNILEKERKDK